MAAKAPTIGELRSRVVICTTVERPDADVSTIVKRPGVYSCRARVRPLKPWQIMNYQAVAVYRLAGTNSSASVEITVRNPPDVKIDLNHWVYEITGYGPSWYRVRGVEDIGGWRQWLALHCSIETLKDERSDPATQEEPPVWEDPTANIPERI